MSSKSFSKSTKRRIHLEDLVSLLNNDEHNETIMKGEQTLEIRPNNAGVIQDDKNSEERLPIPSCSNNISIGNNSDNLTENSNSSFFENNAVFSSSDSESDNNLFDGNIILGKIASWGVKHNTSHVAISELLMLMRDNHKCFRSFPIDARTILKTRNTAKQPLEVCTLHPGIYHHFGLANGIKTIIGSQIVLDVTIRLLIGIDGLPLAKSSDSQFWPILCRIQNVSNFNSQVFLVGLYWGKQKPQNSNEFLVQLVNELKILCIDGISLPCSKKKIVVHAVCCDVPAKSYVLGTKGHSGFSSCTKCTVTGVYLERRVCFPETNFTKRTHEQFLKRNDEDFQISETISILTEIPGINMVDSFPNDIMHCVYLGVGKKLLLLWLGHIKNVSLCRLPSQKINSISIRLLNMKQSITSDFVRSPRGLNEVLRWKATEFRLFILYTGPIAVKLIISKQFYSHFLCLHVAITILLSPRYEHLLEFANELLSYFVSKFGELYGEEFISHNVHSLLHLCDDYKIYGPLDKCSCFPFENFMQI